MSSARTHIQMKKRSVRVCGHDTSITLEEPFWEELQNIAQEKGQSLNRIISAIDEHRSGNLSSAVRVYILRHLQEKLAE